MVLKARKSNGQFMTVTWNRMQFLSLMTIIEWVLVIIIVTPFLYYVFIRNNMISILINYLNKELGCDCSCKNTINNKKMVLNKKW